MYKRPTRQDELIDENSVLIYPTNGIIKINSSVEKINSIIVYDILGKEVFTKTNINSNEFNISDIITQNQSLIVKLTLVNGNQITKKIVF